MVLRTTDWGSRPNVRSGARQSRPLHPPRRHLERRLVGFDAAGVTVRVKDYRRDGPERYGTLTLTTDEFIRRFLLHVLPKGFHRIRHYGLLASATRRAHLARIRDLLAAAPPITPPGAAQPPDWLAPCPRCGERMTVVEIFGRFGQPRGPPTASASTRMRAP